jgi:hypothetical protein
MRNKGLVTILGIVFLFLFQNISIYGQDTTKRHYLEISTSFVEHKDQVDYGLVFRGPVLLLKYEFHKKTEKHFLKFESELGFGASWARGIAAFNYKFKPIQLEYYLPIKFKNTTLFLGAYSSLNYEYDDNPWLHSGRTYWFSTIDFGPAIYFETNIKSKQLAVNVNSSLFSFVSRPEYVPEDYFYDISFLDVLKNMNSDFSFATINKRYSFEVEIWLLNFTKRAWSVAYSFNYSAYYNEPKTTYLTNKIIFRKQLGRKK